MVNRNSDTEKRNRPNTLIVGCGKIGMKLGEQLCFGHNVWGIRRSHFEHAEIKPIEADVTKPDTIHQSLPESIDYLIYCLTPYAATDEAYRKIYVDGLNNVLSALGERSPKRLIFVSSTSVYHQNDSSLVDETSAAKPKRFSGQRLLEAEDVALSTSFPTTIVRFSGIYGGTRSNLIDQVRDGRAKRLKESRITNRIHEDDCVGFLYHLIEWDRQGGNLDTCYLASDSTPAEYDDVIQFIAEQCAVTLQDFAADADQEKPKRRAGNKRCSNKRMLSTGYQLLYPGFREGYANMLNESTKA